MQPTKSPWLVWNQGLFSFHTLYHFNQRVLRHWRELTVDFDENGFFAAKINCVIVKVEKVREEKNKTNPVRIGLIWSAALEPVLEVDFLSFSYYYVIGTFSF